MKITKLLIFSWLAFALLSCGSFEQASEDEFYSPDGYEYTQQQVEMEEEEETNYKKTTDTEAEPTNEEQLNETPNEPVPEAVERKLIKNGRIGFQTDDLSKTHQQILKIAKKHNAYIASDEEVKRYEQIEHNITIRIPANKFDTFLSSISEGIEEFDYKEIDTKDVTAEFLDLTARIKTKKELENRYLEILQKANTVADMLEVERELGQVRAEIESMEGRMKYLSNQVAFSTLNISFYKEIPYQGDGFFARLGKSFSNGWDNLLMFIVGLTSIWPFLILIGLGIWTFRQFWKRRQSK